MKTIKILALNKQLSGSKYHRLVTPLTYLSNNYDGYEIHLFEEKYVNEDICKKYDIVYLHWTQLTRCELLCLWRDKYGFKIIQDIDDYWHLPLNHPTKANMDKMIWQLENQMILADVVLVSTESLREKVLEFNKQVILKKNFLPTKLNIDNNQFIPIERDFYRSSKLNIGICGSISHVNDWLSISNQIQRLLQDKFITDNCNFIISGYSDNNEHTKKIWDKIVNIFTSKNIKPTINKSKPTHEYMELYEEIDILLIPLEQNQFNKYKSELKILESGIQNIIPICNNQMYLNKIPKDCYIETQNYYKTLLDLIKLWKKDQFHFQNLQRNLRLNILDYNNKSETQTITQLHHLIQSLVNNEQLEN